MKAALLVVALSSPAFGAAYELEDAGDFAPVGHRVEFADRFGWRSYDAKFSFGLDESGALTRDSKLSITVIKRDGSRWRYACKAKGSDPLTGAVHQLYGKGFSVTAECRIPGKAFAKAVDLHPDDVGRPTLVFQALVQDGEVRPGAQRGVYFLPGGQIEATDLNAYASSAEGLAVVFRSN